MGGEGSIQHMITSFRNNRSLLRKKSMFRRDRSFLSTKKEYYKASKGRIKSKKLSKEELLLIRKKVIKKRRAEDIRAWLIVFVIVVVFAGIGYYAVNRFRQERIQHLEIKKENILKEYGYFIEEGDRWMEKGNWDNAIYRYRQAVEIFPNEFEGNYRLALAYSYHCQFENKNCERGKSLTIRLIKYFPKNTDLIKLLEIFENRDVSGK